MKDQDFRLRGLFAKNRAEELGRDVWQHFVVPPFFDRLDLTEARKPRVIIGGRGCGKTMLLRYLCHETCFSPAREHIPPLALNCIGLYWRADTQFANAMVSRDQPADLWESAFHHLLALAIGRELLASLRSIARSTSSAISPQDLTNLDLGRIRAMDPSFPAAFSDLEQDLQRRWWGLQAWVNDVRKAERPRFLPGSHFVLSLIRIIRSELPALRDAVFFAYIDEYENLREYQRQIIHTCMKHSEAADALIFNLAVKRNVFAGAKTLGPESLSNIHDWRYHDLEEYLEEGFSLFAAEILFLHLASAGVPNMPIETRYLRDPSSLPDRRTPEYRVRVLGEIRKLLPDVPEEGLAQAVFLDRSLAQKLQSRVKKALSARGSKLPVRSFVREDQPKASIITPALLARSALRPEEIIQELDALERGESNRFTGSADWIHNNFIGCLLHLYEPHSRACPFYAGFNTFCELAHGNIRHMLELCHKSVQQALRDESGDLATISPSHEATAARLSSAAFLGEIRSFGRLGNQLHTFVLRLGSLFALAGQRPTQSEPETTHFTVGPGQKQLEESDHSFLSEAVKWSVLFDEAQTKQKQMHEPAGLEYVLNPIYAPYFHISYRKRRSLSLTADDLITLISGDYSSVRNLLRRYSSRWGVDLAERPTLFSHLQDDE